MECEDAVIAYFRKQAQERMQVLQCVIAKAKWELQQAEVESARRRAAEEAEYRRTHKKRERKPLFTTDATDIQNKDPSHTEPMPTISTGVDHSSKTNKLWPSSFPLDTECTEKHGNSGGGHIQMQHGQYPEVAAEVHSNHP